MEIFSTPNDPPDGWSELIHSSDDAWLFHTEPWIRTTSSVWGYGTRYFGAKLNGRLVAGLPYQIAMRSRLGRSRHHARSVQMAAAGPLCSRKLSSRERETALRDLTDASVEWACENRVTLLACSLPPLAATSLNNARGIHPLAASCWEDHSTHTLISNLDRGAEMLWKEVSYDARRAIRLCQEAGYRAERVSWPSLLDEYYRIHRETYERTGAKPHPRAYFEGIAGEEIAGRGHAVLWVGRDPGGNPVAFHNDSRWNDGSAYWTGCCDSEHLRSGINYLLFWSAIEGARQDGCRWYELGEIFPAATDGKLRGLTVFKSKFGGELHRFYRGEIRPRPSSDGKRWPLKEIFSRFGRLSAGG